MPTKPYLPQGYHMVMVMPDLHIPYHDQAALLCAMKAHEYLQPKRTVLLGDWLDAEPFKSFETRTLVESRMHDFKKDEVDPCNKILDSLQKNSSLVVYIEGNHEFRIEKAAARAKGVGVASVYSLISPRNLLSEGRKNFIWVPYSKTLSHYKITDDLWAMHGWSFSKHVAEYHLNQLASVSCVFGHVHRQQSASRRCKVNDKQIKAWSPGCLCDRQPIWGTQQPTDWIHGFSILYVKNDNSHWFEYTITIENGMCILPGGKLIKG